MLWTLEILPRVAHTLTWITFQASSKGRGPWTISGSAMPSSRKGGQQEQLSPVGKGWTEGLRQESDFRREGEALE